MTTYEKIVTKKQYKDYEVPSESIYNLITTSPKFVKRSPRYQSMYNSLTKKLYNSGKKSHQTMGIRKTITCPCDYLKKHTRERIIKAEPVPFSCNKDHKLPPVPKCTSISPVLQENRPKDFIELNRVNNMRKPALKPAKKLVDNRKGDSFFLEFSGLVPKLTLKKEFGETPKYLIKRQNDLNYADEMYMKTFEDNKLIKMSEEEKNDLLEGLRDNWEELNKRYLTLPIMIDTKNKKTRKLNLEKELDILEHDIYFLEKNKDSDIYILPE